MLPEEIEDHEVLAEWLTEKEEPGFISVFRKRYEGKLVELAQKMQSLYFPRIARRSNARREEPSAR